MFYTSLTMTMSQQIYDYICYCWELVNVFSFKQKDVQSLILAFETTWQSNFKLPKKLSIIFSELSYPVGKWPQLFSTEICQVIFQVTVSSSQGLLIGLKFHRVTNNIKIYIISFLYLCCRLDLEFMSFLWQFLSRVLRPITVSNLRSISLGGRRQVSSNWNLLMLLALFGK